MNHKFKVGQIVHYNETRKAEVLNLVESSIFLEDSYPLYQIRLIKSGLELILNENDLDYVSPEALLDDKTFNDLRCDCGAQYTANWKDHYNWCGVLKATAKCMRELPKGEGR